MNGFSRLKLAFTYFSIANKPICRTESILRVEKKGKKIYAPSTLSSSAQSSPPVMLYLQPFLVSLVGPLARQYVRPKYLCKKLFLKAVSSWRKEGILSTLCLFIEIVGNYLNSIISKMPKMLSKVHCYTKSNI